MFYNVFTLSKGRSGDVSQNSSSIGNVKKSNWRGHTSRSQSDFRGPRSQLIFWSTTEGALSSPGVSVSQGSHMTLGRRIIIMQYPIFNHESPTELCLGDQKPFLGAPITPPAGGPWPPAPSKPRPDHGEDQRGSSSLLSHRLLWL